MTTQTQATPTPERKGAFGMGATALSRSFGAVAHIAGAIEGVAALAHAAVLAQAKDLLASNGLNALTIAQVRQDFDSML